MIVPIFLYAIQLLNDAQTLFREDKLESELVYGQKSTEFNQVCTSTKSL